MDVGGGRKFQGKAHNGVKHKAVLFLWDAALEDNGLSLVSSNYAVTSLEEN